MRRIYNVTEQWEAGEFPSGLAIGDSWFWYPNENLMRSLVHLPQLKEDNSTVQLLGFNGARLAEYVGAGRYAGDMKRYLSKGWREGFSEFYISGAGNDAIKLKLALKADCSAVVKAEDCFDEEGLAHLLRDMSSAIGSLIHDILWAYRNDNKPMKHIFIQGYDYPVPDGRGFLNHVGWLKPAMDGARVANDIGFREALAAYLIDKLNDDVFKPYHRPDHGIYHVDTRNTLSRAANNYKDDWANEMHPTSNGFAAIAQSWLPSFKRAGLTT